MHEFMNVFIVIAVLNSSNNHNVNILHIQKRARASSNGHVNGTNLHVHSSCVPAFVSSLTALQQIFKVVRNITACCLCT